MACACKNRCEDQVAALSAMIVRNRAAQKRLPFVSIFPGILGLLFLFWGIAFRSDAFLLSMGIVFILWSIISFALYRSRK